MDPIIGIDPGKSTGIAIVRGGALVERVRDTYLMPKIRAFLAELKTHNAVLRGEPLRSNYAWDACYCACASGGPCEHRWDGEGIEFDDGCGWTATCSRCGDTAIGHSMRIGL